MGWKPNPNEFEMQGFDKSPFLVTASVWMKFTPPSTFEMTVKKCRDNPEMVGTVLPAVPFEETMAMLIPSVDKWEG